jgi:hypothetical protein
VEWAAVQDIGSTAALLTEMASRYAISNLDVVLPWAAAGNRETIQKKRKGHLAKSQDFKPYLAFGSPRKFSSNCTRCPR